MSYPSPERFLQDLRSDGVDACVERVFGDDPPFAFDKAPSQFDDMKSRIWDGLGVRGDDVTLVGSGRFGFSLDPTRWGAPFSADSDLDIVIVSDSLYHRAWADLGRNWNRAQLIGPQAVKSVQWHRRDLVFFGRMVPDELLGIVSVGPRWFDVFAGMGAVPLLARREVRAQLWHCWDHARMYYRRSLAMALSQDEGS